MSLEIKSAANYAARIVSVPKPFPIKNADRLLGLSLFGYTAVVDLSWAEREGELAVFFPAESQLSDQYTRLNNLYRHTDLNDDPTEAGYIEDSRRIKAIKLRGTPSNALIMPISSLDSYGYKGVFQVGEEFDTINGVEVSRKYVVKEPQDPRARENSKIKKAFKRIDDTLLPEHIDTDQWLRNEQLIEDFETLIVTQKLHGTSARFTNNLVKRQLKWYERALKRLGVAVPDTEYDTVAGSRKAIKDPHNPAQQHFYGAREGDVWTKYLARIEQSIPKGYVVYGEIVGFVEGSDSPIQKGHTYGQQTGTNELYVYRVATVNPDGLINDLAWDQVRSFCDQRGIKHVAELWRGHKKDFSVDWFHEKDFAADDKKFFLATKGDHLWVDGAVPLSTGGTGKDEGIAIRVERGGSIPALFKYKNPSHFEYETKLLDAGVLDLEASES